MSSITNGKKVWKWIFVFFTLITWSNFSYAEEQTGADPGYVLGSEDILEISVWEDERLRQEVVVRMDGMISFPLIGEISAAGLRTEELIERITVHHSKYVPEPSVLVSVKKN